MIFIDFAISMLNWRLSMNSLEKFFDYLFADVYLAVIMIYATPHMQYLRCRQNFYQKATKSTSIMQTIVMINIQ